MKGPDFPFISALSLTGAMMVVLGSCHNGVATRNRVEKPWTLILNRPIAGKYEDISFPTPKDGWVTTATGEILRTKDGGTTWSVQASGLGIVRSVDFVDRRRGFAGTLGGVLYSTTDGGVTWQNITSRLPHSPRGFCGITHVGNAIHVVGRYTGSVSDYYSSRDAGLTWQWADLAEYAQGLVDIAFVNDSVGFIGGMSTAPGVNQGHAAILKTNDGGAHWRNVYETGEGRGFAWKLFPIGKYIYVAIQSEDGIYRLAKSDDDGDHWRTLTIAHDRLPGPAVQGVGFINEATGWVGGFFVGMFMTTDGGESWIEIQTPDRAINRFERVGASLMTAGSRGILRYPR